MRPRRRLLLIAIFTVGSSLGFLGARGRIPREPAGYLDWPSGSL
jgi:hypothetical protein